VTSGARLRIPADVPREMRIHLNQYRDDRLAMKRNNTEAPPFTNEDPI
jgi:hypothetical protein